jgi:hypothetical protein
MPSKKQAGGCNKLSLLNAQDGDNMFLGNVRLSLNYTALQPGDCALLSIFFIMESDGLHCFSYKKL